MIHSSNTNVTNVLSLFCVVLVCALFWGFLHINKSVAIKSLRTEPSITDPSIFHLQYDVRASSRIKVIDKANSPSPGPLIFPLPKLVHFATNDNHTSYVLLVGQSVIVSLKNVPPDFHQGSGSKHRLLTSLIHRQRCYWNSYREFEVHGTNATDKASYRTVLIQDIHIKFEAATAVEKPVADTATTARRIHNGRLSKESFYRLSLELAPRVHSSTQSIPLHVTCTVHTIDGIRACFSSLSQLISSPTSLSFPMVIQDWAEHSHRGLMVDVARHFIPLQQLRHTIDTMEVSKYNTLHLHLTDAQSFPVMFENTASLPHLSHLAKYSAFHPMSYYTVADLGALVQYSFNRGITVIPEIDVPAHTKAWANAFPQLVIQCPVTSARAEHPTDIPTLHPLKLELWDILDELIGQLARVFNTTNYFHVGGDEINYRCWEEDSRLMAEMKAANLTVKTMMKQFEEKVFALVHKHGKVPVVWQGIVDDGVLPVDTSDRDRDAGSFARRNLFSNSSSYSPSSPDRSGSNRSQHQLPRTHHRVRNNAVVEPWKCWGGLAVHSAVRANGRGVHFGEPSLQHHPVIMAACDYLDFNHDVSEFLTHEDFVRESKSKVQKEYSSASPPSNIPVDSMFLGGEGAVWTTNIDLTNFDCRVWPRAAVLAARWWGLPLTYKDIGGVKGVDGGADSHVLVMSDKVIPGYSGADEPVLLSLSVSKVDNAVPGTLPVLCSNIYTTRTGEGSRNISYDRYLRGLFMWISDVHVCEMASPVGVSNGGVTSADDVSSNDVARANLTNSNSNSGSNSSAVLEQQSEGGGRSLSYIGNSIVKEEKFVSDMTSLMLLSYVHFRYHITSPVHVPTVNPSISLSDVVSSSGYSGSGGWEYVGSGEGDPTHAYAKPGLQPAALTVHIGDLSPSGDYNWVPVNYQSEVEYISYLKASSEMLSPLIPHSSTSPTSWRPHSPGTATKPQTVVRLTSQCSAIAEEVQRDMRIQDIPRISPLLNGKGADGSYEAARHMVGVKGDTAEKEIDRVNDDMFFRHGMRGRRSVKELKIGSSQPYSQLLAGADKNDHPVDGNATRVDAKKYTILQLNVADGAFGRRGVLMTEWLRNKTLQEGLIVAGFCELNGWEKLESITETSKNFPMIRTRAAEAGFPYYHVMSNGQPYNIGVISAIPFVVVHEYGPPLFERGVLHTYYPSSVLREREASLLASIVDPYMTPEDQAHTHTHGIPTSLPKVLIMGDFNTLSSLDSESHIAQGVKEEFSRTDNPVFTRLRKKFFDANVGSLNYEPLDILYRAGLRDGCMYMCESLSSYRNNMTACIQRYCAYSEPTLYNPEWPVLRDHAKHPNIRLDYVLTSPSVYARSGEQHGPPIAPTAGAGRGGINAMPGLNYRKQQDELTRYPPWYHVHSGVDMSQVTDILSDHYPVYISWYFYP